MSNYNIWIQKNVTKPLGRCKHFCELMIVEFPELKMIRGHYFCWLVGRREHWWLTTCDGVIVDPTISQFPAPQIGDYEPWNEGDPEPTGKCLNCGEYCFNYEPMCSNKCKIDYGGL